MNKKDRGGAESLVEEICRSDKSHSEIFIARFQIEKFFFRRKFLRFIPIIACALRILILSIFLSSRGKKDVFILFHLAEGHLVARILLPFSPFFSNINFIIYLHQSKELFPAKVVPITQKLLLNFHSIGYSKSATKTWFENLATKKCHFILHNIVSHKILNLYENSKKSEDVLQLVFVGRFAKWKRPDRAIEFASKLSNHQKVKLSFVGFTKEEYLRFLPILPENSINLEVKFYGMQTNVHEYILKSHLLIYLADSKDSGESIGIAAMESLALGVPVLISTIKNTDFRTMPGIFDLNYVELPRNRSGERDYEGAKLDKLVEKLRLGLPKSDIELWRKTLSATRYNRELHNIFEIIAQVEGRKYESTF